MLGLRRRPRSVALLRLGYRVAYRLLVAWSLLRRPRVRGVMCVLRDSEDRLLLVRQTYGDRSRWELPGGHIDRGEAPRDAARREAFEELSVDIAAWDLLVQLSGTWKGLDEELHVFGASWPGGEVQSDRVEILEARWFAPDELWRLRLGPLTAGALAEVTG